MPQLLSSILVSGDHSCNFVSMFFVYILREVKCKYICVHVHFIYIYIYIYIYVYLYMYICLCGIHTHIYIILLKVSFSVWTQILLLKAFFYVTERKFFLIYFLKTLLPALNFLSSLLYLFTYTKKRKC